MLKFIAHDKINDVALIQTSFKLWVRYGLEQTEFELGQMSDALRCFSIAQHHAIAFDSEG